MQTTIMALTIDHRTGYAPEVQTILTKYGCIIKTRIGLHEAKEDSCSELGLIILHLYSEIDKVHQLEKELIAVEGVSVKYMTL